MIRQIITPKEANISFSIPEKYIGKELEVIAFAIEEGRSEPTKTAESYNPAQIQNLKGAMSKQSISDIDKQLDELRNQAWE